MNDKLVNGLADLVGGPHAQGLDLVGEFIHLHLHAGRAPAVAQVRITPEGGLVPGITLGMLILHLGGEIALVPAFLHLLRGALDKASDDHGGDREAAVGPESTTLEVSGSRYSILIDAHAERGGADLAQAGLEALTHLRGADLNAHAVAGLGQPGVTLDNGLLAVAGESAAVVIKRDADAPCRSRACIPWPCASNRIPRG